MLKRIVCISTALCVAACGGGGSALTETTSVTFIHLNDLHAHLTPHADHVKSAGEWHIAEASGWADGFAGIDIELNLAAADGARVTQLTRHDTNHGVQDSDNLTVAGCTRPWDDADILCSYSGFTNVTALINPDTSSAWNVVDFLIYGFQNDLHDGLRLGTVTDSNATPVWPTSDFYQPLEGVGEL